MIPSVAMWVLLIFNPNSVTTQSFLTEAACKQAITLIEHQTKNRVNTVCMRAY